MGKEGHGIAQNILTEIAEQIKEIRQLGVQIAIVLGGGNIYRGKRAKSREWTA